MVAFSPPETLLGTAQLAAARLQLPIPTAFFGSTDNNMILLKTMIEESLDQRSREFAWPELQREHTLTLVDGQANYAFPVDLDRFQFETFWNRSQHWPLIGPLDGVQWQQYKSGFITNLPRQRFRIKYWQDAQFFIDPTPDSSNAGQTIAFEYISHTNRRPKTWVASTSWGGLAYCSHNGNIYGRGSTGAGTTGTTAPTHTSGAVSDGSLTWTPISAAYSTFSDDTDVLILDPQIILEDSVWRFKRERGLDYEGQRADAERMIEISKTRYQSAGVVSLRRQALTAPMIGVWSYPEGSFS